MITDDLEIPWLVAAGLAGLGLALSGLGNILNFFRRKNMTPLDATIAQLEADVPAIKAKLDKLAAELAAVQAAMTGSMTPDQIAEAQARLSDIEASVKALAS